VAPAGVTQDLTKLVTPARGLPDVTKHINPLVEGNAERIVGVDILGEAETGRVVGIFSLKCAEQFVPDDERAAVVAVDVLGIGGVMDAVVSGRVEDEFKGTYGTDQFGMNPELVEKTDGPH
jgi:hypothetical protein